MRDGYNLVRAEQSRAEQSRAERLSSIDILKGIGIISVVIGHAMNTDNYYALYVEYVRRFVYLYHLAIFFFCSGYLFKAKPIKKIVLRCLKQYIIFLLICMSSFLFLPLWINTNAVVWNGFSDLFIKVKHILLFKQDGYFDGAMWFMPFMAITTVAYSILLLIKKKNLRVYYLLVIICALSGIVLVPRRGVGGYYKWLALLMIPIMAVGNEYRKVENKIVKRKFPILVISIIMFLLSTKGEIELSKGIIYGKILFYPITLLGIIFCNRLKNIIQENSALSILVEWIGRNSMFIMGYHFTVFKIIDVVIANIHDTSVDQLQLFPYSFPQFRLLYVLGGIVIPCVVNSILRYLKGSVTTVRNT